jgi:hypothetical protein
MTEPLTLRSPPTVIVLRPDAAVETGGTSCAPVNGALVFATMPPPVPGSEEQADSITAVATITALDFKAR